MTEVLTTLLQKCATEKAQDLYFRPLSTGWAIIERLATGLKPLQKVTLSEGNQWLNQMKYQAGMDISETRRPQTGRSAIEVAGELIYLRLATVGDFFESGKFSCSFHLSHWADLSLRRLADFKSFNAVNSATRIIAICRSNWFREDNKFVLSCGTSHAR